jgi:hypothetical protein
VLPEFIQFGAFFLGWVALLKLISSYLLHRNASSSLGNGIGWFVPGIA